MITKINDRLADVLANALSSMWTFWILIVMIWGSLLFQIPVNGQGWLQFVVQSFFQGVALPVLAFVAKRAGAKTERTLNETHDVAMQEHKETQEILLEMKSLVAEIHKDVHG